ncbi:MAG: 2-C-methyl-D-erythritol 4-phosphate cytidylyltransferase [Clostridia bacterium]|nr:2-C-methyl-D-erythritol 4-phosphate cytidylyltransferase [Clostridia bacterium]
MKKNIGIILAGGVGSRFKGDKPKQYYLINGKEMIWFSLQAFKKAKTIDDFIVVVDPIEYENGRIAKEYGVKTVCGGKTRNWSFKNALDYIKENFPDCNKVIENNAACPLTTADVIDEYIKLLDDYDFVHTTFKITDALGSYKSRIVDREDYFLIQSPDAYRFDLLYNSFNADHPNGHPAVQLPENAKGYNYFDYGINFKVTYPEDLKIVEMLINRREGKI